MFKYNISIPFLSYTQYYGNTKMYYELLYLHDKLSIFLCALYKKGGVGSMPGCINVPGRSLPLNRFAVHCLVRFDRSGYGNFLFREISPVSGYFLTSVRGLGPSSRTVLTTSVTTAPHLAPSDADTNVIRKRRSSRPMLFIRRLTMNMRLAAL
jgi:hypothetical protein